MRNVLNFNGNWTFAKQAEVPAALCADWEQVNLPHCWNAVDGQDGGNDYFRGTCQYAKSFVKADLPEADRYYLEIQGANSSADVTFNGVKLAHHDGGYSTWRVDLTENIQDENLLVISVDNSPNEVVYPQMADFTFYGGMYRNVNLICVPESHFDLDFFGSPGLMVTPEIVEADANVTIEAFVTNAKEGQTLRYTIFSRCGCKKFEAESAETKAVIEIPDVHLWHGRKDPYLYCCEAEIVEGDTVIDNVCNRFGCRLHLQ